MLVNPALPLSEQLGSFVAPVSVGRPPGLDGMDTAVTQPAHAVGELIGILGFGGDVVGDAGLLVVGGDEALST